MRDIFAGGPTLAVCDLVANGFLRLRDGHYSGDRQWAIFEDPHTRELGATLDRTCGGSAAQCAIRWQSEKLQEHWDRTGKGSMGVRERGAQSDLCQRLNRHNRSRHAHGTAAGEEPRRRGVPFLRL